MNKRLEKLKKYLPFNLALPIVLIAIVWLATTFYHNIFTSPTAPLTFERCAKVYGLEKTEPPKCRTPDGLVYMEFKTRSDEITVCAFPDIEPVTLSCKERRDKELQKLLEIDVRTYNECRDTYQSYYFVKGPEPYICIDKNGLVFYAGGENRSVNSYEECKAAGGPIGMNGRPRKCYFDTVLYWQTLKPSHKYLNLPEELKTFEDCVLPGTATEIKAEGDKYRCKAFNGKTYYYTGSKIDSFEDCARVMRFVLESNPPQCYGPDGTHYVGPSV